MRATETRGIGALVAALALAVLVSGCGGADVDVESVADLAARADELVDRTVQVTAQVEFVAGEMDRFRIKDPDSPPGEGVLVRCTPEQFDKVKRELDRLDADRITLIGLAYKTAPPDSKLGLELTEIAGSRTRWLILAGLLAVVAAIAVVVVLLLIKPKRSVEELIYAVEGEETIRRYGQLAVYEGERLTRMWFLSYDRNISEARITDADMVLGTEGVPIGRDNPVLGLGSMTISRHVATLRFDDSARRFVLANTHDRKPMSVSESDRSTRQPVPAGNEVALGSSLWLYVDEDVRIHLLRREDPSDGQTIAP